MKTITIYKRGYDYDHGTDWVLVPYMIRKEEVVSYLKKVFGQDCFQKYSFVLSKKH